MKGVCFLEEIMFDLIVFDNLKVIVEGVVYDFDLYGDIFVIDWKDMMDFVLLSCIYYILF